MKLHVIFVALVVTVSIAQAAIAKPVVTDNVPTTEKKEGVTDHADVPAVGREAGTGVDEVNRSAEGPESTIEDDASSMVETSGRAFYNSCPSKCYRHRQHCPHGCMLKHCTLTLSKRVRVRHPVLKRRKFVKTVPVKKYVCKGYGSYGGHGYHHYGRRHHKRCFVKITYKHVTYYKNYKVYRFGYKYKHFYGNGQRCEKKTFHHRGYGKTYGHHHHGKHYDQHHNAHPRVPHHPHNDYGY